ncbi:cation-transporting P-type ATPase [Phycisphaerales bacterium AB-hyl4]|uniref:Cation-transporting P-type ATPase n=1 Tax=Natronomicrosphaera hydrolytica TaxID=3242702 RepID=A0ABV4U508_9BACT
MDEPTQHPPAPAPATTTPWHTREPDEVFNKLDTRPEGLTAEEASRRLEKHGPNRLKPPHQRTALQRFLTQFHNVLIYVLIVAGVVTTILALFGDRGHFVDAGVIFAVVIINAIIGFVQEGKAERALDAIRHMLSPEATVLRDGERHTIPAEQIVPGDIVALSSGDKVPADLRLFRTRDLRIDEAVLTGESVPVDKTTDTAEPEAAVGDRPGMAFSSALVTSGQGLGIVVGTSEDTEIGRISELLSEVQTLTTPLLEQIRTFGHVLTGIILALAAFTFAFGAFYWNEPWSDMFLAAVGLAVAAIPEGLPAILTITLAIGVQRMARRNAIIRHLPAVDTLGSITVICSDKTGTLTRNEMTVQTIAAADQRYRVTGVGYAPDGGFQLEASDDNNTLDNLDDNHHHLTQLLRAGLLCNDARLLHEDSQWHMQGDPTEGALLTAAAKAQLDRDALRKQLPRTDAIPFESEHKFMATLHHDHEGHGLIYLKGAPEVVLQRCSHLAPQSSPSSDALPTTDDLQPLDREAWHETVKGIAGKGQRLLALAYKPTTTDHHQLKFNDVESDMILLGVVGIIDPPRDEAIAAIHDCKQAGIRVKMITGDHALTAKVIGKALGIGDGERALTGAELDRMSEDELKQAANDVDVFARVSPEHKLRLVEAVQSHRQIVAMTGDGVNDAPALKRADVGVAMGIKGTEVSKEASDMVLADDNFASIASAVEEGRTVYDNIRKAILFLLPTNGGQSLVIIAAVMLGFALPITPVQILWVNMVVAVTLGLALAFEPSEANVMRRPPRKPREALLSLYFLWRIAIVSLLLWGVTFGLFMVMREVFNAELPLARTVAVNALVVSSVFYLFNARYITAPSFNREGIFGSRWVWLAVVLVLTLQMLYTYLPIAERLFDTVPLNVWHWLMILPAGVAIFAIVELEKKVARNWHS